MPRSQSPDRTPDETTGGPAPGKEAASNQAASNPPPAKAPAAKAGAAKAAAGGKTGAAKTPAARAEAGKVPAAKAAAGKTPAQGPAAKAAAGKGTAGKGVAGKGGGGRGGRPSGAGRPGAPRPGPQGRHRLSAAERAALKRGRRLRLIVATVVTVLVAGSIAGVVVLRNASRSATARSLDVQSFADQGRTHLSPGGKFANYNSTPPTSGPHDPNPAPCGVSPQPIPNEVQVHDLEHGVVMVQYRPGLDTAQVRSLESLGHSYSSHVLVAPYPGLSKPVAVTSWTRLMTLDRADTAKIRRFIDLYRQRGPEAGIPCPIG